MTSAESEAAMFLNMANPAKVSSSPRSVASGLTAVSETPSIMTESEMTYPASGFAQAVERSMNGNQHTQAESQFEPKPNPKEQPQASAAPSHHPIEQPAAPEPDGLFNYEPANPPMAASSQEVDMEKQATLLEIDHLRAQGVTISKDFSMGDSLESMQFEVRRHLQHLDETRMVATLVDMFKMGLTGLEMASKKVNFVDLDGYSAEVTADMSRFTPAITRLYRKYYRKSVWSPEAELGFALCSSIAMFHFRKKFYSGGGGGLGSMAAGMAAAAGMPQPAAARAPPHQSRQTPRPPFQTGHSDEEAPPGF
jgi:hypothetical protein